MLEVGAGIGMNFPNYPQTVRQVVAMEPELRLAARARTVAVAALVPVVLTNQTVEEFRADKPFDAVVCSLVLCSVRDPALVLRHLYAMLGPGRGVALSRTCGQRRLAGPAAAVRRRHRVAAVSGQLSHPSRHRTCDC